MVDAILESQDTNRDGYLDYFEYYMAKEKSKQEDAKKKKEEEEKAKADKK